VSPAKTAEPIEMPFDMWTRVGPRNYILNRGFISPHIRRGNFVGEKGPAHDMPAHAQRSIYSKRPQKGAERYGVDADWFVLDGVHSGAAW